jgi:Protein of unknown function (DUF2569)
MTFPEKSEVFTSPPFSDQPRGIGGWLILPLLGFVGTIILTGWNLSQVLLSWEGIVTIFNTSSMAEARLPVALSFLGGALVIASAALCLFLIFAKKRAIVKFATAHYLILAVAGLIDLWGQGVLERAIPGMPPDPTAIRDAVRGFVIAAIWIPYFHVSKRVRNTFTG